MADQTEEVGRITQGFGEPGQAHRLGSGVQRGDMGWLKRGCGGYGNAAGIEGCQAELGQIRGCSGCHQRT